jgi:hypothetical protein
MEIDEQLDQDATREVPETFTLLDCGVIPFLGGLVFIVIGVIHLILGHDILEGIEETAFGLLAWWLGYQLTMKPPTD